jgi:hypothetical protein
MSNNVSALRPAQSRQSNSEYLDYLQSPRWRTLRRAVCMRAKGRCEICRRNSVDEVAHLTYERIFHEHIEDLLGVCRKCHRELDQPNW